MKSMGQPVLGFCGGRVDAQNGADSVLMGPTSEQQKLFPCQVNGQCKVHLYIHSVIVIELIVSCILDDNDWKYSSGTYFLFIEALKNRHFYSS
jgi:hypothetical protein